MLSVFRLFEYAIVFKPPTLMLSKTPGTSHRSQHRKTHYPKHVAALHPKRKGVGEKERKKRNKTRVQSIAVGHKSLSCPQNPKSNDSLPLHLGRVDIEELDVPRIVAVNISDPVGFLPVLLEEHAPAFLLLPVDA